MDPLAVTPTRADFSALRERMQWYVDQQLIPHCAWVVLRGTDVIEHGSVGTMGPGSQEPLRDDAIFRMYSDTKPVTTVAALMLLEQGRFALDDPIADLLPEFAAMTVLRADARSAHDVEPARSPITVRQILSHSAGLSYGFMEPDSIIDRSYMAAGLAPFGAAPRDLAQLCAGLARQPLAYQPGTDWRYSYASDVTARLIEVASGQRFDEFLQARIFGPLGMVDTGFHVPEDRQHRFTTMAAAADIMAPMKPGLHVADLPRSGAFSQPKTLLSGGAGLVSTVADHLGFVRAIINGGQWNGVRLLRPETLAMMHTNQLADGVGVRFPLWQMKGTVFGLGFAILEQPGADDPVASLGEYHWGGMAGTHTWFSPRTGLTGLCLTQRMPGFWHPFSREFRRMVYELAGQA
ncbi:MAG: serine hydrolase domain-containing protein [Burkholderiaceae bacterium]